jgi:hypothetical protein
VGGNVLLIQTLERAGDDKAAAKSSLLNPSVSHVLSAARKRAGEYRANQTTERG